MTNDHFIVVGGGLAGLTAAVALAERGHRVTLLEQSHRLGGRASTESRNGFQFNLGPHALYRNGPAHRTLLNWGIPLTGRTPSVKSDAYLAVEGELHAFPADVLRLFITSAFRGTEKLAAARAFGQLMAQADPRATALEWIEQKTRPGRARMLVEALIRLSTYANQMELLSAQAALQQVQFAIKNNVLYIDGGWETLVTGLAAKAQSLGVTIETGAMIDELPVNCSGTILAVPPSAVEKITGRKLTGSKAASLTPIHMATLDLALTSLPEKAPVFALGLDQPMYFSRHSATAQLAPEGHHVVHVSKYLSDGQAGTREELEKFATLIMPGWRDHLDFARFLPHLVVTHAIWTPAGRPGVDALGIPRVAIAGDWVGDTGMLADAAVASGLRAAEHLTAQRSAMAA
jgi:phytoene dehydrogenase-like protein